MTTEIEQVKDTIRKLRALASNDAATEGEVDNAIRFATRLMAAHHLSHSDIENDPHGQAGEAERVEFDTATAYTTGAHLSSWEGRLATFVENLVGSVGCYNSRPQYIRKDGCVQFKENGRPMKRCGIVFYGPDEDARLAAELYEHWAVTIAAMARLHYGGALRGDGRSYAAGFVDGLFTKLKKAADEMQQTSESRALVVRSTALAAQRKTEARAWLAHTKGIKLRSSHRRVAGYNQSAHSQGRRDGQRADVTVRRTKRLPSR